MTKIILVDDDPAILDALGSRLELAGYAVETHEDAERFLDSADLSAADCIMLDIRMPKHDGMEVLERLQKRDPALPVVMMTGHGDVDLAVAAIQKGAMDFLEKPFPDARLMDVVEKAAVRRETGRDESRYRADLATKAEQLTPREVEVFRELVTGQPNKVIAYNLGCSPRTVEIHRARVMTKMGAQNLAEIVRMAIQLGIQPEI
ncbi:response regulator transcription factor [Parasphingopyxis lamellibrachiae]|uniref:LuxR family two component transcriptional regulator n=1 Tax=Parasphingopyxis lamellibrachiae TaxID=680125 RepID=A0A3D9FHT0_9SPHN|nr:response regulator [Parasphingopyxis lamellibrachiae]RED16646.1 LuxR family two component transcriptional regulator [Parasphingopyxis lamellibrachiae]